MMTDDEIEQGSVLGHKLMQVLINSRPTANVALLGVEVLAGEFLLNQADDDKGAAELAIRDRMVPNIELIIDAATKIEESRQPRH
jgi:hypothetical protein